MPADLRKAHQSNDRAVLEAYGFLSKDSSPLTEGEIVAELFRMYEMFTAAASPTPRCGPAPNSQSHPWR